MTPSAGSSSAGCAEDARLDETTTLWRNGLLAFAPCDGCGASNDVLLTPTDAGVAVRTRRRGPVVV